MTHKIALEFTCFDRGRLRAAYVEALKESGYGDDDKAELVAAFDRGDTGSDTAALAECFANAVDDWMRFGVEY